MGQRVGVRDAAIVTLHHPQLLPLVVVHQELGVAAVVEVGRQHRWPVAAVTSVEALDGRGPTADGAVAAVAAGVGQTVQVCNAGVLTARVQPVHRRRCGQQGS